jgi:DNA-directed RNA polymerase specialized sigma24 family protein
MQSLEAKKLRQFILEQDQTSRYILLLHYYENLTTHEISLVLDLTETHVKKRLATLQLQAHQQILIAKASWSVKPTTTASLSAIA